MGEYKVGALSQLLQSAGSAVPKSGVSFLTSKKPTAAVSEVSKETHVKVKPADKGRETLQSNVEKKKKKKKEKNKKEKAPIPTDCDTQLTPTEKEDSTSTFKSESKKKRKKNKKETEKPDGEKGLPHIDNEDPTSESEVVESKKKRKKKKKTDKTPSKAGHQPGYNPPAGIVHESLTAEADKSDEADIKSPKKRKLQDSDSEDEVTTSKKSKLGQEKTRKRRDRMQKKTENRTIFIGNLPITVKKRQLLRMFKEFGEIETVRYRCLPVNDPSVPKRVIAIKGDTHPDRNNCAAYVCFREEDSVPKALILNGKEIDGLHIRVDKSGKRDKSDMKKSVFVGNLPYNLEEEKLREHFEDCGNIENVRIVRDRITCVGKGFGYIKFSDKDAVSFATKLNGSAFLKRKLRVMACVSKPKQPKDKSLNKTKKIISKQNVGGRGGGGGKFTKPGKQREDNKGKSRNSSHAMFGGDGDSDLKQKQGGKFKDTNDRKPRKNFKDGKPKKKSFRPSNMKKNPFQNKAGRKESKKQKQKKPAS